MKNEVLSFRPGAWYYRTELRGAATKKEAVEIGLGAVMELEQLRAWVREQGLIPPKWTATEAEIRAKVTR